MASATPLRIDPTPTALAHAMQGHSVVLLGEVHDNAAQHALRAAALQQLLATGVRPAIALEQFDREHQGDIDRARRERPTDADYLIARAKGDPGWNWNFYRPYVALALKYDLPIVAANLSRHDAIKVAIDGWGSVFDAATIRELGLDALPADLRRKQEHAIAVGHCNLLPAEMLPPRANAQMARDIVMAQSIRRYWSRGVVLLAGNGHVRRDIGVPVWLPAEMARGALSIGLLERAGDRSTPAGVENFDAYVVTEPAERTDPCKGLEKRLSHASATGDAR
ncbi:MAG: ChaN family lipoprotein [Betaproteobacteria bacterium]